MPPAKRLKTSASSTSVSDELQALQNEINKIKRTSESVDDNDTGVSSYNVEQNYLLLDDPLPENKSQLSSVNEFEDLKKFIREQIRQSERRIQNRCDIIEGKLIRLLDRQIAQSGGEEEELFEEEHLYEMVDDGARNPTRIHQSVVVVSDLDFKIFPISDEATFDWFFDKLKDEEYNNALIERRWHLTRTVNVKSLKISVKDFLQMHFDLSVCIKYSISGFGAHGIRKKKLDSNSLTIYVFECFNRSFPGLHLFQDVSKAIVQFWGRTPEYFSRANERAAKHEYGR